MAASDACFWVTDAVALAHREPGVRGRESDVVALSDAGLVHAIAGGEHAALAEAYERHNTRVHGLATRMCGRTRADDLTQEVFCALWTKPHRYDAERGSLRSFLLMQTHGRSIDLLRNERSRQARESSGFLRRPTSEAGAEGAALAVLASNEIERALSSLPVGERDAIVLAYFGDHSYREVARLLDEAEGTIKSRIRKGLIRLRVQLAGT
jgi:RNA polymerase sigma-70 factor, ECF subfamily